MSVLDLGRDGEDDFLVMELVIGETLAERSAREGPFPPAEVARIGAQLAAGLAHAHEQGLVHRDVKPANVVLDGRGARLTDFGIAKSVEEAAHLTGTGVVMGTAGYLAPEQLSQHPVDARVDQFALGCVLFELLTGRPPYGTGTPVEVAARRFGPVPRASAVAPGVPGPLDAIVMRAMASDPADRFPDATAMAIALQQVATQVVDVPASGWSTAEAPPVGSGRRRHGEAPRLGWMVVLVALLAAAALIGLLASRDPASAPAPAGPPASPGATPGAVALDVAALSSFDPQGDGSEHDRELSALVDGDPATMWTTDGYNSAAFGNLKDGVGLVVALPPATRVAGLRLEGVTVGTRLQLRTAAQTPSQVEDTIVAAETSAGTSAVELILPVPQEGGVLLVWISGDLPREGGLHRAAVGELSLLPAG